MFYDNIRRGAGRLTGSPPQDQVQLALAKALADALACPALTAAQQAHAAKEAYNERRRLRHKESRKRPSARNPQ